LAKTVHYINLDIAVERRAAIEKSFQGTLPHEWQLKRFPAITARDVENVPGKIIPGQKACFLSHRNVIRSTLDNDDNEMIVEDDCSFSKETFRIIDDVTNRLDEKNWDILFLEIGVGDPSKMIELKLQRNRLAETREISLLDLSTLNFFGTLSYVINKNSKPKILQHLDKFVSLDAHIDITLRHLFQIRVLKGVAILPFLTTPSVHALTSSFGEGLGSGTDIWMLFRHLMFMDRNLDEIAAFVSQLEQNFCDAESRILGGILATCVSPRFKPV
jgi:GR25 family glycosyltransferase involved in LPS biosynthesis